MGSLWTPFVVGIILVTYERLKSQSYYTSVNLMIFCFRRFILYDVSNLLQLTHNRSPAIII